MTGISPISDSSLQAYAPSAVEDAPESAQQLIGSSASHKHVFVIASLDRQIAAVREQAYEKFRIQARARLDGETDRLQRVVEFELGISIARR